MYNNFLLFDPINCFFSSVFKIYWWQLPISILQFLHAQKNYLVPILEQNKPRLFALIWLLLLLSIRICSTCKIGVFVEFGKSSTKIKTELSGNQEHPVKSLLLILFISFRCAFNLMWVNFFLSAAKSDTFWKWIERRQIVHKIKKKKYKTKR